MTPEERDAYQREMMRVFVTHAIDAGIYVLPEDMTLDEWIAGVDLQWWKHPRATSLNVIRCAICGTPVPHTKPQNRVCRPCRDHHRGFAK